MLKYKIPQIVTLTRERFEIVLQGTAKGTLYLMLRVII